jgi:ferredoxin--NADP+ reductase
MPGNDSIRVLREAHYNATVSSARFVHDELLIVDVVPDGGPLAYEAGQYTVIGVGYWEPRLAETQSEPLTDRQRCTLAKRAYSISCPILDARGALVQPGTSPELEFYVSLVRRGATHPPAVTPRLFQMKGGDRLFVGPRAHGNYTLKRVQRGDNVLFAATGTGEAPHNAMIAQLLARGHQGRITSIVCVRYRRDLGYLAQHLELERRYSNYRYIPLTTREPENLDTANSHFVGKLYIQDFLESDDFQTRTHMELIPTSTHVFLCGSPDMIGAPHHPHSAASRFPVEGGTVELLERRGFTIDSAHGPGNIHFERYW